MGWTGGLSGPTNPVTLTITANQRVTAVFAGDSLFLPAVYIR